MNKKKKIYVLISFSLIISLCLMTFCMLNLKSKSEKTINTSAGVLQEIGISLKKTENTSLIINLFSPTCEHCQRQAEIIKANEIVLKTTQIILVSFEEISPIKKFISDYQLDRCQNITVVHLQKEKIFAVFGSFHIPQTLIYSSTGKLQKKYIGETKIEAILKYLK